MIKYLYLLFTLLILPGLLSAQDTEKSGWTIGGVPAISYNSDRGFQYGVVLELYNFGDGSDYPNYQQTIQGEWSRTTGGSGINEIFFDAPDFLWGNIRLTSYAGYRTELLQPFYGFGGYETMYNPAFAVSDPADSDYSANLYKSRFYYAHDRRYWSLRSDLQGPLGGGNIRWVAGINLTGMDAGKPDIDEISSNLSFDDDIPDSSLYESYVQEGIIPADEAQGGQVNYVKFGAIYDTRDTEANPMSGIWTELLFTAATEILGSDFNYTVATLTHRQYFTLIEEDLSFAYRLGIQSNVAGDTPFFMQPFIMSTYKIREGLGGAKTLRGILLNRVVGESIGWGNFELRWKFYRITLFNQNFYTALNTFFDTGRVLGTDEDSLHHSYGFGLRIAMNQNFIVGIDYGRALDDQDGDSGLYIGLGFLY